MCSSPEEAREAVRDILEARRFGDAGARAIVEDKLIGEAGLRAGPVRRRADHSPVAAQDHKAAYDGDKGPNTGGMGAYAPAPVVSAQLKEVIVEKVLRRTVRGMAKEGIPFQGVLYAGLMIVDGEPSVLEFNVRFGDPECQPLMALMKEDIVPVLLQAAEGTLEERELEWHPGSALCVVLAAGGYPGIYEKGKVISGLDAAAEDPNVTVFHAGTKREGGVFVTAGGRVLGVTALGDDLKAAQKAAYAACEKISWDEMHLRRDIGYRAL